MRYRGLDLDAFQEQAISSLEAGRSVLVCAPTGTGKTIIADWIVDQALQTGHSVVYTAPIKALSNQKFRDYCRTHGDERVGLVTGDLVIRRQAPCLVMTTEILRNMLLAGEQLEDLRAVIIDEIHFLDDRERGTVWEEVLIYLPEHVQVVGLSATLSNLKDFAAWLADVRGGPVDVIEEHERAVPLELLYHCVDTGLRLPAAYEQRWRKQRGRPQQRDREQRRRGNDRRKRGSRRPSRRTGHLDVFLDVRDADLLPYLYFVFSRRDTEVCAKGLGRKLEESLVPEERRAELADRLDRAARELGAALDPDLRALYAKGVAFHHAGLHVQLKALVEELYEARFISALYCTSTFALGINMPARTVVFDGLRKFDGRTMAPLTTRQFMQKAGRAGRRGMDTQGHVVIRVDFAEFAEAQPQLKRYAEGAYEPVRSSFSLSWNSVVNLLATHDPDHIRAIVDKSFLNWHLTNQAQRHLARAKALGKGNTTRRQEREVRQLTRRARRSEGRCWEAFQARVFYLRDIGYIGVDGSFHAGANILRHLQFEEIFLAELVLNGIFEGLAPPELFGVMCGLTNELPRHASVSLRPTGAERALARRVRQVRNSDVVIGAEQITGLSHTWDPDLLLIGRAWADGRSLQEILMDVTSQTDISGDLVTGFRRAKDLAGQLRDLYVDLPERADELSELIRSVSRDEVEVVG